MEQIRTRFFVSSLNHKSDHEESCYQVGWSINPHMKIGQSEFSLAESEHRDFVSALESCGAAVTTLPFVHQAYDSVFMKDNFVAVQKGVDNFVLLAKPSTQERLREPESRRAVLSEMGFKISGQTNCSLEGGDVVLHAPTRLAFLGYGFRTDLHAAIELGEFLGTEVTCLKLVDPYFYHLDTALSLTQVGDAVHAFAYRGAFSEEAWWILNQHEQIHKVHEVSKIEAMKFALNWVEIDDQIILGSESTETKGQLEAIGKRVLVRPLSQFQLAGGSAACLVAAIHSWS